MLSSLRSRTAHLSLSALYRFSRINPSAPSTLSLLDAALDIVLRAAVGVLGLTIGML